MEKVKAYPKEKNAQTLFHKKCKLVGKKSNHTQVLGVGNFGVS
jgi:hypothetical protein